MGNYRPFLQGPLPVANYTRIIIPGRFWTRPPSTKSTRMASSATPLHDSLIELAIPDAHAHAIKWYLNRGLIGTTLTFPVFDHYFMHSKFNSLLTGISDHPTHISLMYSWARSGSSRIINLFKVPFNCVGVSVRNG